MRPLSATAFCFALAAAPLSAQVGHPPDQSPYRDIVRGKSITVMYGEIGGNGGTIGVGPHDGPSYGIRFDIRMGTPIQLGFAVAHAELQRLIVSADDSVHDRVDGPVDQNITMIEAALQFNLTGKKTWHRLAPFLGASLGYVWGSELPPSQPDSSGYKFGSKFYFAPGGGLRTFLGQSLHLRLEARGLVWKLSYPSSYTVEPAAEPSFDPKKPNAVLGFRGTTEWPWSGELRAGLGFNF
jgi:hypothetical protein